LIFFGLAAKAFTRCGERVTSLLVQRSNQETPFKNKTPKEELHRQAHRRAILALVSRRPVHRTAKQLCIEEQKQNKIVFLVCGARGRTA
jgi:hypothetical protein